MKKDVTYDLLNHISVLTARLSGCTVPESRLFSKKDIQIQLQEMRKLIIDGELDILPEQKNDLSNYTVGEIKDICTKHKKVDEWGDEHCDENCLFHNMNGVCCPFDYDPNNWVTTRKHLTDTIYKNGEDWLC